MPQCGNNFESTPHNLTTASLGSLTVHANVHVQASWSFVATIADDIEVSRQCETKRLVDVEQLQRLVKAGLLPGTRLTYVGGSRRDFERAAEWVKLRTRERYLDMCGGSRQTRSGLNEEDA